MFLNGLVKEFKSWSRSSPNSILTRSNFVTCHKKNVFVHSIKRKNHRLKEWFIDSWLMLMFQSRINFIELQLENEWEASVRQFLFSTLQMLLKNFFCPRHHFEHQFVLRRSLFLPCPNQAKWSCYRGSGGQQGTNIPLLTALIKLKRVKINFLPWATILFQSFGSSYLALNVGYKLYLLSKIGCQSYFNSSFAWGCFCHSFLN